MAADHVQTANASLATGNGQSVDVTLTPTAANAVAAILMFNASAASVGTITQTAGDTMALLGASLDGSGLYTVTYITYAAAGGSTTFTFGWDGSDTKATLYVIELSGLGTGPAFDQMASTGFAIAPTLSTGTTPTLSQPDELAIAIWNADDSGSTTLSGVSNGFTIPTNGALIQGAVDGVRGLVAYKVIATTDPVESTATTVDAEAWHALILTLTAVSGSGSSAVPVLRAHARRRLG